MGGQTLYNGTNMDAVDMQPEPFQEEDFGFTINLLRSTISKHFIVNDVRFDRQAFAFFVQVDERTLEQDFDDLRREMMDLGYVPNLLKERAGFVVYVVRMPERKFRGMTLNVVLLVLTILSTIGAGMIFVSNYEDLGFWTGENVGKGALYFAAPLMLILGLHEMGHYTAARRHRVAASLPFFIPAPPFPFIIGTFGAFISLREPIHSKRSLMDIGFAGPIAGFVVAIVVTVLGFKLSAWDPHYAGDDASETILLGTPLIFNALAALVPTPGDVLIHPTAFAGWVGFLVTFLNLLPAGQLDGGHIFRALFGNHARYFGYATIIAMVAVSWATGYWGWVVFIGFIILFLNHPPPLNDISPLPPKGYLAGLAAVVMLVVCFVPAPFQFADLEPAVDPEFEEPVVHMFPGEWTNNTLVIVNTGNTRVDGELRVQNTFGWSFQFEERVKFKDDIQNWSSPVDIAKDRSTNFTTRLNVTLSPPRGAQLGDRADFTVQLRIADPTGKTRMYDTHFRAYVGWIEPRQVPEDSSIPVDWVASFEVRFKNLVANLTTGSTVFDVALDVEGGLRHTLTNTSVEGMSPEEVNSTPPLDHLEMANNETTGLLIWVYAPPGTATVDELRVDLWVAPSGSPGSLTRLGFLLDVGSIVYDVSLSSPHPEWSFEPDGEKNVIFNLTSHSNVDVNVTIDYSMTGPDAFEFSEEPPAHYLIRPGRTDVFTVTLFAKGDVDDTVSLRVEISYGVGQASSVTIMLVIVSG